MEKWKHDVSRKKYKTEEERRLGRLEACRRYRTRNKGLPLKTGPPDLSRKKKFFSPEDKKSAQKVRVKRFRERTEREEDAVRLASAMPPKKRRLAHVYTIDQRAAAKKVWDRLGWYKHASKRRGKQWSLEDSIAVALFKSDCDYCGSPSKPLQLNGIDRVDNTQGYHKENVVACCSTCNYMKRQMTTAEFYCRCRTIVRWMEKKYLIKSTADDSALVVTRSGVQSVNDGVLAKEIPVADMSTEEAPASSQKRSILSFFQPIKKN